LGSDWSDITNGPRIFFRPPHFDFNLLPISRLCVEKRPRDESSDIGLLMSCEPPIHRIAFRTADVSMLSTAAGHQVLFLDMQEVARSDNLRLQVETAVKHEANPLMELGPAGAFDEDRVFNHGCLLHDNGKYRMWYGGLREPRRGEPRIPWYDWIHCGYAESENGIDWRRTPVNQVEWNGSKENNIVPYFHHAPLLFRDDAEPDPERRYKGFYFWNSGQHMEIARTGKYVSRDSETFHHVLPEQHIIPVGDADAFDALNILPTTPIILDDEIRLLLRWLQRTRRARR
jgi:hypothetical protein